MKIILIILAISFSHHCYAQNFDEWFRQKKTQIKYLMDQVAANKVYIDYLEKGYKIAKNGLTAISDIKNGEFNLHNAFFTSLSNVNPLIKKYARVGDIITRELQITGLCKATLKQLKQSGQFSSGEVTYVTEVFTKLLDETAANITELTGLITSGNFKMSDDGRLRRIDNMYEDMEGKYAFVRDFSNQAHTLAIQRLNESNEVDISKSLYNLPQ